MLVILFKSIGGQRDDRQASPPMVSLPLAYALHGGVAVHHRHLQVHQNDIGQAALVSLGDGLHALLAIVGQRHRQTQFVQQ